MEISISRVKQLGTLLADLEIERLEAEILTFEGGLNQAQDFLRKSKNIYRENSKNMKTNGNASLSLIKSLAASLVLAVLLMGSSYQVQAAQAPAGGNDKTAVAATKERKPNPNTQYGKVQQRLREMGLYKGEVTGFKNQETTDALTAFQKQNNLKVTGTLSKETKDKLGIAGAPKAAKSTTASE